MIFWIIIFIPATALAQDQENTDEDKKSPEFLKRLTIVESLKERLKKGEPAAFSYTNPRSDTISSSYLINAAIGYDIRSNEGYFTSISVEWQKNTNIEKKQDKFFIVVSDNRGVGNTSQKLLAFDVTNSINYAEDKIDKTKEWIVTSYWLPLFKSTSSCINYLRPDDVHPRAIDNSFANILQYSYDPYIGFEYQNKYRAEEQVDKGYAMRFYFRFHGVVYPASNAIKQLLELYIDWTYRTALFNNIKSENTSNKLFKVGFSVNYKLPKIGESKEPVLKFGYEYVNGADPIKGLKDQDFDQIVLKFKF